jgi:3'(2'), 5'-bisphosphate nucleotidase
MSSNQDILFRACYLAGKEILEVYTKEDHSTEIKEDNSPLTAADRNAHIAIALVLSETDIPVLSEEGKYMSYSERQNWDQFWLVDPLDGTKEFIKRNGEFTVNIALIDNGNPILGIVYAPVIDKCWIGDVDLGSFVIESFSIHYQNKTIQPIRIQSNRKLRPFTVVGSRSHASIDTNKYIDSLKDTYGELNFVSMGSSLKLCMVAEGMANVYPRFAPTMEWDTAAGHAVALAAGCKVINAQTQLPLSYNKENLLNPWFIVEAE